MKNYFHTCNNLPATHDEIKLAWNAQADEFNQWDELGEDEKVEWAAAYAVAKLATTL